MFVFTDPVLWVDGWVKMKSQHWLQLSKIENEIDETQAKELEVVRNQVIENAKQNLKAVEKTLVDKLKAEGTVGVVRPSHVIRATLFIYHM